jgi:3'(2'), 5'-bisphosphate nucleotidase
MHQPHELLEPVTRLAITAGRRILEIYESGFAVSEKADETPVTEADYAAHEILLSGLSQLTPQWPVLTEESAHIPYSLRQQWQRYWLVDPLDGTREFINRSGEFSVNIALVEGNEAILGVIYAPVLGAYYYACRGHGAFKKESTNQPVAIHVTPPALPLRITCGHARCSDNYRDFIQLLDCPVEMSHMGGAIKSCLVAEGVADLYARLGPTSEWDTAAAQCIVEEAGGQITDLQLQPLRYNTRDSLLNPHFVVFGCPSERLNGALRSLSERKCQ